MRKDGRTVEDHDGRRLKRLALVCLSGGATAAIVACAGTSTVAPPRGPAATETVTPSSGSSGASSASATPFAGNAAAMVASYYRTIVAQNYRLAYTYLAPNVTGPDGRKLTLQAFLQLARVLENEEGPVTSFAAEASNSMVVMTIYRKRVGPYHAHLQMARDGSSWAIISIDRI